MIFIFLSGCCKVDMGRLRTCVAVVNNVRFSNSRQTCKCAKKKTLPHCTITEPNTIKQQLQSLNAYMGGFWLAHVTLWSSQRKQTTTTHSHEHTWPCWRQEGGIFRHWLGPLRAKVQLSHMLHSNKETHRITERQPGTQWMTGGGRGVLLAVPGWWQQWEGEGDRGWRERDRRGLFIFRDVFFWDKTIISVAHQSRTLFFYLLRWKLFGLAGRLGMRSAEV